VWEEVDNDLGQFFSEWFACLFAIKGPRSPKMHCASRSANLNFMWHETFKTSKICYPRLFSLQSNPAHIILIRLCKYVPCSTFYSFPVLFCTYLVYIYKISRYKLTSTRRDGGLFELLQCLQPIRSHVWTIERFKTKTNDHNDSWMKVGL